MKRTLLYLFSILAISVFIAQVVIPALVSLPNANAVSSSDWKAGRIIDDGLFTNGNDMSVSDIQTFLNTRVPACDSYGTKTSTLGGNDYNNDGRVTRAEYAKTRGKPERFTCLRDYYEVPKTTPSPNTPENNYGGKPVPNGGLSSAQIIYNAATKYSINAKVILVKIATESPGPLTGDEWPFESQYTYAMGSHCPDSGPGGAANCDTNYSGFSMQVDSAAQLMRWYLDSMNQPWWSYKKPYQNNNILWNVVESQCGGSNVYIETKATAALYTYTPYQPNQTALNNMYSTGDRCSAYGNRNFWRVFNDWFGTTSTNARVYIEQYDSIADMNGDPAKYGFSLNMRPSHPVTISVILSDNTSAGLVGNVDRVTIQPENWNDPLKNQVAIYGKDNGTNTASLVTLTTSEVSSYDPQFDFLTGVDVGDPLTTVQGGDRSITRLYSPALNKHLYTSRQDEINKLISDGYRSEGLIFNACASGDANITRLVNGTTSLLTLDKGDEYTSALSNGFKVDSPVFSASTVGTIPIYRLLTPNNNYFYTPSKAESDNAVQQYKYKYEGIGFMACSKTDVPVSRLYNPTTMKHFYTASATERDTAGAGAYRQEGVAFYISKGGTMPVFRLYNAGTNSHFYTTSIEERDYNQKTGYRYEGVAFSLPEGSNLSPVYRLYSTSRNSHFYTIIKSEADIAVSTGLYKLEGIGFYNR